MKLSVFDKNGKEKGSVNLPDDIFDARVNTYLLHQAIVMYQACLRQGTIATKNRGAVSGGGKKPFRQKGTGRARAGSSRSPLMHGGGVVFGPVPRDFSYSIPKKMKGIALRESLKAKYHDQQLICIEDIKGELKKTKEFAQILKNLKLSGKILGALDGSDKSIPRVSRNIRAFSLMRVQDLNAYDIMRAKKLFVSETALKSLLERIQK
ncbi:MAG TPA: 50S ribosomal protein L4 [Candidatus Omnitrophota bacterium]|nr:50S ribosomal protein L4 [Candidatus Omnitrophota bacterium]